jgi:putative flippase GtrA
MTDGSAGQLRELAADLASWARFGKFASVGVFGAVCDTTTLLILVEVFGVLEEVATIVGIEVAIVVMFLLNEHWTFSEDNVGGIRAKGRRLVRSHLVRAGGSTVQFLTFVLIYRLLFVSVTVAGIELWLLVAKFTGVGLGMVVNYTFESLFTWQIQQS